MTAGRPRVLAVIPARGGSKGVPRKNLRPLGGKPLIVHTIDTALAARDLFRHVVVSTDDEEIAAVARRCGAEAPFLRPAELATDAAPTLPVVQHAIRYVEAQDAKPLDWIMLLQPTAPLRSPEDLREAMRIALRSECDSVLSLVRVLAEHPVLMKRIEDGRIVPYMIPEKEGTRRQDYEPAAYMRNGAIYLTRRDVVMERGSLWGGVALPYVMPEERSVSIDSELDWLKAEALLARRGAF